MALRSLNATRKKRCREGALKVVRVENTTDDKSKKISFDKEHGVLVIHAAYGHAPDGCFTDNALLAALNANI